MNMKRIAIIALVVLIIATLAACAGRYGTGTTTHHGGTTTSHMTTSHANMTTGTSTPLGTGAGTGAGTGTSGPSAGGLGTGTGHATPESAVIMYNGAVYRGSKDELPRDDVGRELAAVSDVVDGHPQKNGEASGVMDGTKLFAIKNINDRSAIAFESAGKYYKATKQA